MAEERAAESKAEPRANEFKAPSRISGWIKALLTSAFGLVSGAVLMYLTPLVNSVIKPGKPVPNFAQQASGLTVTFNNRSTGGTQGWWDFGDGTALEPFEPGKDTVTHTYTGPGNFNVKLTLQNLLGEENERIVPVIIPTSVVKPTIEAFAVVPITPSSNAPATFKIVSQVRNAKLVAWDFGDAFRIETSVTPDKYVTLQEPGYYTLRLVAFNGAEVDEKSQQVMVGVGDSTKPMATLKVIYDGIAIEQKVDRPVIILAWDPKQQGATCPVSRELTASEGWTIADAKYEPPVRDLVRNLKPEVSADRTRLRVSGEMVKPKNIMAGKNLPPPQCGVRLELTLVKRGGTVSRTADPVAFELNAPGSTALPLPAPPAGLEVQNKRIALEIKDGSQVIWNNPALPSAAQMAIKSKMMRVSALEQGGQLRVDIVEARPAIPVSQPKKNNN